MIPISQEKVEFIISMAREFREGSLAMVSEELSEGYNSDNYTEHSLAGALDSYKSEDHAQDSAYMELKGAIEALNEDEKHALVALMWIGRGTYGPEELELAIENAKEASNKHTAEYLIDSPLLPDYLEEGLTQLSDNDEE
ncbi:MAG: DUF3775 domain-containing protein [Kordiimonadaceae bacterium]|nr:DUF3775 domain-containing protein [Kordiimonadaceae bacterium]